MPMKKSAGLSVSGRVLELLCYIGIILAIAQHKEGFLARHSPYVRFAPAKTNPTTGSCSTQASH